MSAEILIWQYAVVCASDMASAFGVVLKKHRLKKKLSQEELAERADIHPTHVSLIERFERNASLNVAKALAKALDVSLAELIREAESVLRSGK